MPYQIELEDGKHVVYNLTTKKKEGTYDTRSDAMKRMKKLYEADEKKESEPVESEDADEDDKKVDHGHNDDGEDQ